MTAFDDAQRFRQMSAPLKEIIEWCENRGGGHEDGKHAKLEQACYDALMKYVFWYTTPFHFVQANHGEANRS